MPLARPPIAKTGRFTVQAVKYEHTAKTEELNEVINQHKNSLIYKKALSNVHRLSLSKQVFFQNSFNTISPSSTIKRLVSKNHHRANSLPPPKLIKQISSSYRHSLDVPMQRQKHNSEGPNIC